MNKGRLKLAMLVVLTAQLLAGCGEDGVQASPSLLTDDLTKVQLVGNQLEIHTKTEVVLFDENRDTIVQRGDNYKLMKVNKDGADVAYMLQVPKSEYEKYEEYYNTVTQ